MANLGVVRLAGHHFLIEFVALRIRRAAVVGVAGEFAAGDPVEVVHDGEVVGKGVAEHSAAVIGRLRGLKSAEVGAVIGDGAEEAVHRDRFVLL